MQKTNQTKKDFSKSLPTQAGETTLNYKESVNHIFIEFSVLYGHRFTKPLEEEESKDLWKRRLSTILFKENISRKQIMEVLSECATTSKWPPSIPEFIQMCKMGKCLPKKESCLNEGLRYFTAISGFERANHIWSHKISYWTAMGVGSYRFKMYKGEALNKALSQEYKNCVENMGELAEIPAIKMIEEKSQVKVASKKYALQQIAGIKKMMKGKKICIDI